MTSRNWVKLYCDKWLSGTIREESPEIRAVFVDLLALAGGGQYGDIGEIRLANDIGYTDQQISDILHIKTSLWRRAKQQLIASNRIELQSKGAIIIVNWSRYQSEYQRQKPYRTAKSVQKASHITEDDLTLQHPPEPLPEKENEKEREKEKEKESYSERLQPEVTPKGYTTKPPEDTTTGKSSLDKNFRTTPEDSFCDKELHPTGATSSQDKYDTKHRPVNVSSRRTATKPARDRQRVLDFLLENGPCRTADVMNGLGFERIKVGEYLGFLKTKGLANNVERGLWTAVEGGYSTTPVKRKAEAAPRSLDYTHGAEPAVGELATEAAADINEVSDVLWYLEEPAELPAIAETQTFGDSSLAERILGVLEKHGWVTQDGDIWQCVSTTGGDA